MKGFTQFTKSLISEANQLLSKAHTVEGSLIIHIIKHIQECTRYIMYDTIQITRFNRECY